MIRAASTDAPRNISSASSASGCEPCCTQMAPANTGGRRAPAGGLVNPDRQPRTQTQLRPLGNAHHLAAGPQRIENAPLADPFEMLGRTGAAQDGQAPQFVGFVVGGRIGQHVRLGVFDADHAVDAVGQRLRQAEQVGARVIRRVARGPRDVPRRG